MSWQEELTVITRTLINDMEPPYEYSDPRIQQVLVVAAKYVQFDVNLSKSYNVDVIYNNIVPDPVEDKDEIFTSLMCLKAACIIDQGTLRTRAALEGIKTALGPASLSIGGSLDGWQYILNHGACALYEELTNNWDIKNATAFSAVLSPFVSNKFDPRNINVGPFRNLGSHGFY